MIGDVEIGEGSRSGPARWSGGTSTTSASGHAPTCRTGRWSTSPPDRHAAIIGDDVTVGHQAVLHGCTVKDRASSASAPSCSTARWSGRTPWSGRARWCTPGTVVPPGTLVLGTPARVQRGRSRRRGEGRAPRHRPHTTSNSPRATARKAGGTGDRAGGAGEERPVQGVHRDRPAALRRHRAGEVDSGRDAALRREHGRRVALHRAVGRGPDHPARRRRGEGAGGGGPGRAPGRAGPARQDGAAGLGGGGHALRGAGAGQPRLPPAPAARSRRPASSWRWPSPSDLAARVGETRESCSGSPRAGDPPAGWTASPDSGT